MKFSIPVDVQPLNVNEDTTVTAFDNTTHQQYTRGMELQNNNKVYVRSGLTFTPDAYAAGDDANYEINDIVFKDGFVQWCTAPAAQVPKLPQEYDNTNATLDFTAFTQRYSNIGTQANGTMEETINGITHRLYADSNSPSGWVYELIKTVQEDYWGLGQFYEVPVYWVRVDKANGTAQPAQGVWHDDVVFNGTVELISINNPYGGVNWALSGNREFAGNDGHNYKIGDIGLLDDDYIYYYIHREETKNVQVVTKFYPEVVTNITEDSIENLATCYNASNCAAEWYPKFIYLQPGGNVWVRTDQNNVIEYKTLASPTFQTINSLVDADGWGWSYNRPTAGYSPFDGINYTYYEGAAGAGVSFEFRADKPFDTLALSGLIASEVEITFTPDVIDAGHPVIPMIINYPETHRDVDRRLEAYQTTSIIYAPYDVVGKVLITLKNPDQNVRLGTAMLGLSVDAGFTNLVFKNSFQDLSPYSKDKFGNIVYIPGVKINTHEGTVDVPIDDYDMQVRLKVSLGGQVLIINGSDLESGVCTFASTRIIARLEVFSQETSMDGMCLGDIARYAIKAVEIV